MRDTMDTEKTKEVVMKELDSFYPCMSTEAGGKLDRLSDHIVAALNMNSHYLYRAIEALTDSGLYMSVISEGEPVEFNEYGVEDILKDPKKIFELTQEVDEAHLILYNSTDASCEGWVYVTNLNDEDESILDWTYAHEDSKSQHDRILNEEAW